MSHPNQEGTMVCLTMHSRWFMSSCIKTGLQGMTVSLSSQTMTRGHRRSILTLMYDEIIIGGDLEREIYNFAFVFSTSSTNVTAPSEHP